jgi:uracil-DNA glycosylase family protein
MPRSTSQPPRRVAAPSAPIPESPASIVELRAAAEDCRACPLWKPATQTVFGEGPEKAKIMLIGEQPGDEEDVSGRPFVGPAGKLLDRALAEIGIQRDRVYVTNAGKHFKFELRGKRRLHKSPERSEQHACFPWLQAEIARLRPKQIVCLGAIAAQAIFGPGFRLLKGRGIWHALDNGAQAFATVHPAFVLRQRDAESREREYRGLIKDLSLLR